jgi:hypothetical protein
MSEIGVGDQVQVSVDTDGETRAEEGRVLLRLRSGSLVIRLDLGGNICERKPEACQLLPPASTEVAVPLESPIAPLDPSGFSAQSYAGCTIVYDRGRVVGILRERRPGAAPKGRRRER